MGKRLIPQKPFFLVVVIGGKRVLWRKMFKASCPREVRRHLLANKAAYPEFFTRLEDRYGVVDGEGRLLDCMTDSSKIDFFTFSMIGPFPPAWVEEI